MKMKKLLAVVLALTVALTMGFATTAVSFAGEGADSITVTKTKAGETYDVYKMLDLKVNAGKTAYSYTVNKDWKAFFEGFEGDGAEFVTISNGYVTEVKDVEGLAKAAKAYATANGIAKADTKAASGTEVAFTGLDDGYYLITSTLGTAAMIQTTPQNEDVTINDKNPEDTIEKQVKEDSTDTWGKKNDAQVGDVVEFQSTAKLLPKTRNVKIHDTMTEGLTFTEGSVVIKNGEDTLTAGTNYTVTKEEGDTFTIVFTDAYLNALTATTTLTVTYTATLNAKAVNGTDIADQTNTTSITYGDKQSQEAGTTTTTHKFSVFKHAKDAKDNLAGAVFSLKKAGTVVPLVKIDDNNYRVALEGETGVKTFTTVASGDIVIIGVDSDKDYTLEETQAPEGYNQLDKEVAVTVGADNATRVDVVNNTGGVLPSTGGIGTTIFYILGALLIVGCGVILIARRRSNNA